MHKQNGSNYTRSLLCGDICSSESVQTFRYKSYTNRQKSLSPVIHTVASGIKKPEEITFSIKELFHDELSFIQLLCDYMINKIVYIDNNNDERNDARMRYDYLIIALGSSNFYYGITGAEEYTYPGSVDDAIKLKEAVDSLISGSTIIISGGGATGSSLAGAFSDNISGSEKIKIKIIEAQNNILHKNLLGLLICLLQYIGFGSFHRQSFVSQDIPLFLLHAYSLKC